MRAIGYALVAAGVLLLVFGMNAYHSASSGVSRLVTGSPTDHTITLLVGGVAAAIAGIALIGRKV